jgi:circadian clock protein KaiB
MKDQTLKSAVRAAAGRDRKHLLRLYVTGTTSRSRRAILNIKAVCQQVLHGKYELEIIDIHQNLALAKDERIIATPTLVKRLPLPLRRLVGDFSDRERVLLGLDLKPEK